jgi:hypothetical protein
VVGLINELGLASQPDGWIEPHGLGPVSVEQVVKAGFFNALGFLNTLLNGAAVYSGEWINPG